MGKVQKILIILNLVVVLAGAGLVYYAHNIIKPEPTNQAAEAESLKTNAAEQAQVQALPMKKFVVNLHSRESRLRYLDVEMNILPFHNDQKELIKANEYILKDILIDTLSGKILFENKLKKQINAKLGQPVVKKIYFSGFIVQ